MPFTLTHPAAVLPLARTPLVPSALVIGAMAPDLPYYVSLRWLGGDYNLTLTHQASSLLWLDPLIALVLLAVFRVVLFRPLVALLPPAAVARLRTDPRPFGPALLGWTVLSAVVGAATHLAWDALGDVAGTAWSARVNLAGGLLGGAVISAWVLRWWRSTEPRPVPAGATLAPAQRLAVVGTLGAATAAWGAGQALAALPGLRADLRGQGASSAELAEHVTRLLVTEAGTALAVGVLAYAVAWHVVRRGSRAGNGTAAPGASI
ncbi:DUF4184 family protein [Blastococcus sp. TF02A-30]|uniref:DUF4184 family protein n=1 Tax=Blastococcus sp. TF02A-30 TaxID=2250580 RepID=UPI000DEBF62F|nr:DUF4184 family protein [Blastococcus sp. TF02A-30]RBY87780.1 DUF4184 domain-containing protein [Blastococcus sp. TF02A-30]